MFKFENSTAQNYFNSPAETITVTTEAVTLDEILQSFERFLRGCGFSFEGVLDIVVDEPLEEEGGDEVLVPPSTETQASVGAEGSDYKFVSTMDRSAGANGPAGPGM
jgi:hypothetical protein